MSRLILVGVLAVASLAVFSLVAACGSSEPMPQATNESTNQAVGARTGEQIFASTCATCHGAGGAGADDWMIREDDGRLPPPPLNGEGHTWHHSDGVLYGIVSEGGLGLGFGSNMPAFQDELTREEIISVLEYVKTLWAGKEIDGVPIAEHQKEFSETDPYPETGD